MDIRDRDLQCRELLGGRIRAQIAHLLTPNVIEEHRLNPLGPHSDELARLLKYFRRGPLAGKYAVWAKKSFGPYQIVALSGVRGMRPKPIDDLEYATIADVYHAIFLHRIDDFTRNGPSVHDQQ